MSTSQQLGGKELNLCVQGTLTPEAGYLYDHFSQQLSAPSPEIYQAHKLRA
ncbi:conserved protein of unknown function [Pseudomonas marincola]|uniref:Uncharacterized protein n=1 Tax=Pseudomonas marincola TaxID=437900 RepID=A0A653E5J7_9PSED|nr:conserved protein of unknown function [Pseudomonas marincola]